MMSNNHKSLNEKICVVTGSGGNTGSVLVKELGSVGAMVIGTVRGTRNELKKAGDCSYTVDLDMQNLQHVRRVVREIILRFERIDVWINAVGGFTMGEDVARTKMSAWDRMLDLNFKTALNGCRTALRPMQKQGYGRIINFGAQAAETGRALTGPYVVSKAAVHALTQTIAAEAAEKPDLDITCNALLPGVIDTPNNRRAMPDADPTQWTSTEDIAATVIDLIISERNGELIHV